MKERRTSYLFKLLSALTVFSTILVGVSYGQKGSLSNLVVKRYKVKVLEVLPHDVNSYTQGLFFYNDNLYESTGLKGSSSFRKIDIKTGKPIKSISFPDEYFAEGSTVLGDKLFVLTWQNRVVFVYDIKTLKQIATLFNPKEGWGLTTDGKQLIMSDGSSSIFFIDPDNFKELSKIDVKLNGKSIDQLNELEFINGEIWANVYQSDTIVVIDPKTGNVKSIIDCRNLLPRNLRTIDTDVLNGIAYNPVSKQIFLTGKLWPKMYRIQLVNQ